MAGVTGLRTFSEVPGNAGTAPEAHRCRHYAEFSGNFPDFFHGPWKMRLVLKKNRFSNIRAENQNKDLSYVGRIIATWKSGV